MSDPGATMAALRARGAERFDPVRYRFIEALARRAQAYGGEARRVVDGKLAEAVAEYGKGFEQAEGEARKTLGRLSAEFPDAAEELGEIYRTGDFGGLRRVAAKLEGQYRCGPLTDLVGSMAQQAPEKTGSTAANHDGTNAGPGAELKSVRYFGDTWSKLGTNQRLTQALAQGPENAGPLNSHLLVLKSLETMRDISPDYLNRFMSYVDALLWLDQAGGTGVAMPRNAVRGEGDKRRKSGRAKSGRKGAE